jgi:hypothetical protein
LGFSSLSTLAFAQTAPAPVAPAPAAPATQLAPAQPAPAAVPPGYKLVPIDDPSASTRYDVQYPQRRGALPPGMELPYEEGDPIPDGYRVREQKRRGLIIAGSIVTGIPWMISLTAAVAADYDNKSGFLVVPAIGPWLMLAAGGARDEDCHGDGFCSGSRSGLRATLVLDGLMQTAGAIMFVSGFAFPRHRLVRNDVTVSFAPTTFGPQSYGLGAVGTF